MVYFPSSPIITQFAHESVVDAVRSEIEEKYGYLPDSEHPMHTLKLDPGGMICNGIEPITGEFNVEVKPEHILTATFWWSNNHRKLDAQTEDGDGIIKVYLNKFFHVVMPESMYYKIGAWLVGLSGEGQVARMELAEALNDHPNLLVGTPAGDAEA
jgi:hypothetical protein